MKTTEHGTLCSLVCHFLLTSIILFYVRLSLFFFFVAREPKMLGCERLRRVAQAHDQESSLQGQVEGPSHPQPSLYRRVGPEADSKP